MRSSGEKERRGFFTGPLPLRDVATNISLEAIQTSSRDPGFVQRRAAAAR